MILYSVKALKVALGDVINCITLKCSVIFVGLDSPARNQPKGLKTHARQGQIQKFVFIFTNVFEAI